MRSVGSLKNLGVVLGVGFGVAACAAPSTTGPNTSAAAVELERLAQEEFVLREKLAAQDRVEAVARDVFLANAEWCGERVVDRLGIYAPVEGDLDEPALSVVKRGQLRPLKPIIQHITRGSGAEVAGLLVGDKLVALNDVPFPETKPSAFLEEAVALGGPLSLTFDRNGHTSTILVASRSVCDVPIEIEYGENPNAYTDGEKIVVQMGLLDTARTDHELAAVLGHELAHVLSGHIEAKRMNALGGAAAGLVADIAFAAMGVNTGGAFSKAGGDIGAIAFSQDFEREADYVGAYFAHAAGYNPDSAPVLWRRMASVDPTKLTYAGTHPTSPERFVALSETAAEIERKKQAGEPLKPTDWSPGLNIVDPERPEQPAYPD